MIHTLSVKCKLIVPIELRPEIDQTLKEFADACNQILEVAKHENCWNTTKLHHRVYRAHLRSFERGNKLESVVKTSQDELLKQP